MTVENGANENLATANLGLIRDIRRLEAYQRNFFVKVKESLNHVHFLVDKQLMDVAWSSCLANAEENVVNNGHVEQQQLLKDREKLQRRFRELSVKTSLSEFVVNSRGILDVETVREATDAIVRGEKPNAIKADANNKSIVDHTFFLANFCTTTVASNVDNDKLAANLNQPQQQQQHPPPQQPQQHQQQHHSTQELAAAISQIASSPKADLNGASQMSKANNLSALLAPKGVNGAIVEKGASSHPHPSNAPLSFARIASLNLEKAEAESSVSDLMSMMNVGMGMPLTSANPRYYFDIAMEGKRIGQTIIEVQPNVAPKMARNFGMLVNSARGFGYKGCQFFQAWKGESVICGDWEHNSGRGGKAALEDSRNGLFTPDETRLACSRGAVGMRRMSKKHSSANQVASQFRIILANNMNTQFSGIFGHVVSGIEVLDQVGDIGAEGGKPEKIAAVIACGMYKA